MQSLDDRARERIVAAISQDMQGPLDAGHPGGSRRHRVPRVGREGRRLSFFASGVFAFLVLSALRPVRFALRSPFLDPRSTWFSKKPSSR
jgi:hypothetical protein